MGQQALLQAVHQAEVQGCGSEEQSWEVGGGGLSSPERDISACGLEWPPVLRGSQAAGGLET
jgi:hypothetical protein